MRYTLVMTRVKIEYMLFAAMSLVAEGDDGRGPGGAAVGGGPWGDTGLFLGGGGGVGRFG